MSNTVLAPEKRQAESGSASLVALIVGALVVAAGVGASAIMSQEPGMAGWMKAWWPFVVLAVSVGVIISLITVVGVHAFYALVLAAMAAGLMSRVGGLPKLNTKADAPPEIHWVQAVELTTVELGKTAGQIGVVIALAAVIGMCLLESGAADKVVRYFLRVFGEQRAGLALLVSTYIVSVPIFFDTIFMLLVPLAKVLHWRTGKDYLLYVLAICCAGVITHSMVIPHPGPLAMVAELHLDAGMSIWVGLLTGIVPLMCGWMVCRWINGRMTVVPPEASGESAREMEAVMDKPETELPSLFASILPVILPVALIWIGSVATVFGKGWHPGLQSAIGFIGNRNTALLIGTVVAVGILMRQRGWTLKQIGELVGPPFQTAGVIILITSAGGAFGAMLRYAGVGDAIKSAAAGHEVNLIVLAWVIAIVLRVAQGSATVAMLTTAAMIYPLMTQGAKLPYHPVYIFLSIGYGAMGISWMNDSGFWVVSKLGGMTEKQTLRSWTVLLFAISAAGLLTTMILAMLLPMA
ncbi:MAG TPA: SLC13 family permease [Tepidisphaeraceae bacterium]|nr:SLC13 family permease [Tepidisphaeraceae bacterium]